MQDRADRTFFWLSEWNHRLECWISLKYPIKRDVRAKLAKLYFELAVLPGMDARLVEIAANMTMSLIEHKKRIDIQDLQLPWRPIYQLLEKELCKPPDGLWPPEWRRASG